MLEFFRKYQRFFFLVMTTVIILSFSFFGTFSTFTNEVEVKERTIGKALDGSDLKLFELQRLARFLSTDAFDAPSQGSVPNFMNDGVLRKDFFATGLASLLAEEYFEPLREELQTRMAGAQRTRFYAHPEAPFLNVHAVWDQFNPALSQELAALMAEKELSASVFSRLSQLYLQQTRLPPEFLRRVLLYQAQQYGVRPDPELQYGDFSLFGYHTIQDWFGGRFLDLTAQFIHNGALAAQEKGYRVTLEEAKADLVFNFEKAMDHLKQQKQQPITFDYQLKLLGIDEKGAVEAWQKVLLFRRYFHGIGESVLMDGLPYRDLSAYAKETAVVQVYGLPDALTLKTAEDLYGLQLYLDAVAVPEKDILALPTAYRSVDEIEKRVPEFVETLYKAQMSRVSKGEVSLKASLKETLQWEIDHWDLLSKQFTQLSKVGAGREERFAALQKLDPSIRSQIDSWSRLKLVDAHPEWIEEAFFAAEFKEQNISVSANRVNLDFVQDPAQFSAYLRKAADGDVDAKSALSSYTEDGAIYRFDGIEKISDRQIRTLAAVKRDGILNELVERQLEQSYPKIRTKSPTQFQTAEGDWKPFSEVKEAVVFSLISDLRKAIDSKEKTEKKSIDFYVSHRLAEPMRRAAKEIQETQQDPKGLEQFKLVRQQKKLHRTAQENWMNTEAFILVPNQWSPVHVPPTGQIVFFYLQERINPFEPVLAQLEGGKETISRDAKRILGRRLLDRIKKQKAVILPMQKEEDHV